MHKFSQKPSVSDHFLGFQQSVATRIAWPYSFEKDSLVRWRANILSSILIVGLITGVFAFAAAAALIVKKNAWGLAFVDSLGLVLCLVFLFVHRIRYEIRAAVSLLMFYVIGMAIILSVGPLSGGPAWLFAFAVIAGVLMGNTAAFAAIILNALSLAAISILILTGRWGHDFVFFTSSQAMAAAGVNFIVLNSITAVSVSTLVKGLYQLFRKKEELAEGLASERSQLIQTKNRLESEVKERKSAETRLQENQKLLAQITKHTSAMVSIHDADGNYVFASPSHEQLGYTPQDLIGKSGFTMVVEEDIPYLLENFENAKRKKISSVFLNYRLKNTRGGIHNYQGSFDGIINQDGTLERIICVGEDITELRKAQAEKIQALTLAAEAQKLALVGQVAGKMAHDFNNILGVVMGTAELAILDCPHEQTRESLQLIFDQTIRGKNLTKNLVAFARDQEPKQEFFDIDEKIDLVLNLLKKDLEGIDIKTEYADLLPALLADPGMIEHALVNIFQNAVHATSMTPSPKIVIRAGVQEKWIVLEIEDNGCGISETFFDKVFEPSFTLKGSKDTRGAYASGIKGTGYGMANVKRYIQQHNGSVSIASELQKGTTVTIRLPVIKRQLTPDEITGAGIETFITNKHILVVEDEPAISDIQSRILSQAPCHHTVDIAEDGPAALDLLAEKMYDLISLDYILPGNFTGMDIYRHIREISKTVPVLFISGNIEFLESIKELQQKDPHIDHVSKPCMNMDYVKRIHQLLLHQVSGVSPKMGQPTGQTPESRAGSLVQKGPEKENAVLPGGDEHILLVDDEKTIVQLQTQVLEELGYTITSFTDSLAAVDGFQADPEGFDLVITDMAMPRMTGAKLAGEMIAIRSDIPIIMCTGFSDRISEETAKFAGIKHLFMKPLVVSDLAFAVRKVLDEAKKKDIQENDGQHCGCIHPGPAGCGQAGGKTDCAKPRP
jgi:PAS domain S-box-containing protein